jgi:hypothetical protein
VMAITRLDVLPGGLREAADRLGIGHRRMYRLAKAGQVPFVVRLGWGYVVPVPAWNRFLANGAILEIKTGSTGKG